ncbi:MAG: hypothetical protein GY765_41930 [bacterium]|nr:hypothetical protein [bacterium]
MTAAYLFSFLFPFLLLTRLVQLALRSMGQQTGGRLRTFVIAAASAIVLLVPIKGIPTARYLIALNADFSIPLTVILFDGVLRHAFHVRILNAKSIGTSRIFGVVAGLLLYPAALGLGSLDPFSAVRVYNLLFIVTAGLTIFLLLKKNRFGIVLIACIAAYHLHLLESPNFWNYLVDPFYFIAALVGLLRRKRPNEA